MYYNQYLDTFDCDGKYNSVDKIIVFFKKRVIFKQYIPKKYKQFGINIYRLCNMTVYTSGIQPFSPPYP
jgi:hypothetical protein